MQFVEFKIDKEHFGIDISKVKYIEKYQHITKVPDLPKFVEGIINLHDEIIPIYNLHHKFKLGQINFTDNTVFIIVNLTNTNVGLIVDGVSEIINENEYQIDSTPSIILESVNYLSGVAKLEDRIIMLLDVDKIIDIAEQNKISHLKKPNETEYKMTDETSLREFLEDFSDVY